MLLYVPCPSCGKLLRFPHELLGHTTLCPACGAQVLMSAVTAMTEPPQRAHLQSLPPAAPVAPAAAPSVAPITPFQTISAIEPPPIAPQSPVVEAAAEPMPQPVIESAPASSPAESSPLPAASSEPQQVSAEHVEAQPAGESPGHFDQIHLDHGRGDDNEDMVQWDVPATVSESEEAPPPALPHWSPPPLSPTPAFSSLATVTRSVIIPAPQSLVVESDGLSRPFNWLIVVGSAVGVLCVVVLIVLLVRGLGSSSNPWEQQNRDDILSLKESAEHLALNGQYAAAIDKYDALQRLVAGHQINDPILRQVLETARQGHDKLFDLALAGRGAPAIVPATAPSVPAPALLPPVVVVPHEVQPEIAHPAPATLPATRVVETPRPHVPPKPVEPVVPARPRVRPSARAATGVNDQQIGAAIKKATDFLIDQFDGSQIPGGDRPSAPHDGVDVLAVYALMQAGLAMHDDRLNPHSVFMKNVIEAMKRLPMRDKYPTYGRAIRATALALYDRPEDAWVLKDDVNWLLDAQKDGAFTYTDQFPRQGNFPFWDNSNSQYGLLGVWSGAEVGVDVPSDFWRDVQGHWTHCQLTTGEWGYRDLDQNGRTSMTLAGIASLFITQDYLDATDFGDRVGRKPFTSALEKGLLWLEDGDNSVIVRDREPNLYYTLYALERVGLTSGFKFFGTHDWYRQHAADLVAEQESDGSWGQVVDTSYALLFLARGRHPIIMNKLRFDGDWANRPRDVANLAPFASRELERPLNWQVVPLSHPWQDWTDSPILYLASDLAPHISDDDRDKLKNYIENGGLLLTQADGDSPTFNAFAENLGKQMFPYYSWTDLPADSPIYTLNYKMTTRPHVRVITNGSRILMMHWPNDLSKRWQLREEKITTGRPAFELGVNLFLYAAGRTVNDLPNRLQNDYIPVNNTAPAASIKLACLRYDGNWDPEPAAWPRAAKWFREQTSLGITIETTNVADLATSKPRIAHLTGTARFNPTDAQAQSIKNYVDAGGVLIIDPCGVPGDFYTSVKEDLIPRAFPAGELLPIASDHPLLTASADGMEDLSNLQVREYARISQLATESNPRILRSGKGCVILFPLDVTTGLLPTAPWPIAGYTKETALPLVKNLTLWAWDGARDQKAGE